MPHSLRSGRLRLPALLMVTMFAASCATGSPPPSPRVRALPEPPPAIFSPVQPPAAKVGGNPKLYADEARDALDQANRKLGQAESWVEEQRKIWSKP